MAGTHTDITERKRTEHALIENRELLARSAHLLDQTQAVAVESMSDFQLSLRKDGKRTVKITPASLIAPIPLLEYGLGDRVPVYATDRLRQSIPEGDSDTVYQRIYGIPITLSDDGVETVSGLVASPDGFS